MSKRQLAALVLCSVVYWTVGNGMTPLLPVFTESLGADTAMVGYSLSIAYVALAAGAMAAGWLVGRVKSLRRLLIISAFLSPPFLYLMGQATSIVQLVVFMSLAMFMGGLGLALISILTGYLAAEKERGRVFGALAMTGPVGILLGGLGAGPVADAWGFPGLFAVSAAFSLLAPLLAWLLLEKTPADAASAVATGNAPPAEEAGQKAGLGRGFTFLFLAALVVIAANVASQIGRTWAMNDLGFNLTAISSTQAVSGLVTLPLPLLAGWLSDRMGRRLILGLSYVTVTLALLVLVYSTELWHFWAVIILANAQATISGALTPALGADLVRRSAMGRAMALLSVTTWIGGILGFAAAGEAVKALGLGPTMLLAGLLPLVALALLGFIRPRVLAANVQIEGVRET